MADARRFCRAHGIGKDDTALIVFLVEHHLTMSTFAQKQDLTDPEVIRRFAAVVRTEERLTGALSADDVRHPRHQPEGLECSGRPSCSKTSIA